MSYFCDMSINFEIIRVSFCAMHFVLILWLIICCWREVFERTVSAHLFNCRPVFLGDRHHLSHKITMWRAMLFVRIAFCPCLVQTHVLSNVVRLESLLVLSRSCGPFEFGFRFLANRLPEKWQQWSLVRTYMREQESRRFWFTFFKVNKQCHCDFELFCQIYLGIHHLQWAPSHSRPFISNESCVLSSSFRMRCSNRFTDKNRMALFFKRTIFWYLWEKSWIVS